MQNDKFCLISVHKIESVRYVSLFAYPKRRHLSTETYYKNFKTDQERRFSGTSKIMRYSPPKTMFLIHT